MTLKDNESVYSSSSSLTSSSTSSKLSKIVKNMIQRKSSHYDLPTHKRSTIHFSFLFPRKQESPVELNTSKSLLVKSKKRRNSVINLASRFLQQTSATKPDNDDVWVRQRTRSCQDQSTNDNNTSFLELHNRLLNDYNRTRLSNKIALLFDLHKLIDMVTWDTQQAKEKVIQEINHLLLNTNVSLFLCIYVVDS